MKRKPLFRLCRYESVRHPKGYMWVIENRNSIFATGATLGDLFLSVMDSLRSTRSTLAIPRGGPMTARMLRWISLFLLFLIFPLNAILFAVTFALVSLARTEK